MVRRYYKRRKINPDKYSVETLMFTTPNTFQQWTPVETSGQQPNYQTTFTPVAQNSLQGMRKAKHFEMTFSSNTTSPVCYALVYTPAGYDHNNIQWPTYGSQLSIYEPNQFVAEALYLTLQEDH